MTGTPREGDTLTASEGTWERGDGLTYAYQWQRCDAAGGNCAAIAGAASKAYVAQTADVGRKLRVEVAATDRDGSSQALSTMTRDIVARGADPTVRPERRAAAPGRDVLDPGLERHLPERLNILRVEFQPAVLRSRAPFTGRFRVMDTRGYAVRDALVYVVGVPFSRVSQPAEVKTGVDGWATIQFTPTQRLTLRNGYYLTMFVRARTEGGDLLAGVSTRRLVSLRTATPS